MEVTLSHPPGDEVFLPRLGRSGLNAALGLWPLIKAANVGTTPPPRRSKWDSEAFTSRNRDADLWLGFALKLKVNLSPGLPLGREKDPKLRPERTLKCCGARKYLPRTCSYVELMQGDEGFLKRMNQKRCDAVSRPCSGKLANKKKY